MIHFPVKSIKMLVFFFNTRIFRQIYTNLIIETLCFLNIEVMYVYICMYVYMHICTYIKFFTMK